VLHESEIDDRSQPMHKAADEMIPLIALTNPGTMETKKDVK
jgi:hypothetical protein